MTKITEDYCSFEIAKLLKEKGFDEPCYMAYVPTHKEYMMRNDAGHSNSMHPADYYAAPSQAMAMKWLREIHYLVIQIEFIDFLEHGEVWLYSIIERKTIKRLTDRDEDFTEHSYEEACEAAIKYCLENLILNNYDNN